ncbi:MAG TPA: hypothetical protein VFA04_18355 [Bryobacteraceae bacterium]|nr:hypothetical protein [Bryobacteraceae bacterium]
MIHVFQQIFERALTRLSDSVLAYLPPLIVAVFILGSGLLLATLLRWLILRAVKATALDRFLLDSGLGSFIDRSGRLRAAVLLARLAWWFVLGIALLMSIDVFDTTLTSRVVHAAVFAVPKLITAAAILFAGYWLAQYLGRSALVWAVNEEVPMARRLAAGVKAAILFFAIVIAAESLGFAARVFFSTFVIVTGGAALAGSIAAGLALRPVFERWLQRRPQSPQPPARSLWSHL